MSIKTKNVKVLAIYGSGLYKFACHLWLLLTKRDSYFVGALSKKTNMVVSGNIARPNIISDHMVCVDIKILEA